MAYSIKNSTKLVLSAMSSYSATTTGMQQKYDVTQATLLPRGATTALGTPAAAPAAGGMAGVKKYLIVSLYHVKPSTTGLAATPKLLTVVPFLYSSGAQALGFWANRALNRAGLHISDGVFSAGVLASGPSTVITIGHATWLQKYWLIMATALAALLISGGLAGGLLFLR